MNIGIYGLYYLPYIINRLKKDGHYVCFNKFDKNLDVIIVESRFYMYDIYRKLKVIKRNNIKLINQILDIPPWCLSSSHIENNIKDYVKQTIFNQVHKRKNFHYFINQLTSKSTDGYISNSLINLVEEYFNSIKRNRIYFQINYKKYLKYSDLNLSISNFTKELVQKFLKMNTEVCYPCVNSDFLLSLPHEETKYDAINISRIVPYKNQEIFVKAANKLDLNILIIGSKSSNNIELNAPHVYIKDHKKVMKLLNQSSFYVDASEFEGFGMTPVEAAFLNKISIVSDTYIHREVLGNYPIYFKLNDIEDLTEKMNYIINSNHKINNEKIIEKYSIDSFKKRLFKYIESIL